MKCGRVRHMTTLVQLGEFGYLQFPVNRFCKIKLRPSDLGSKHLYTLSNLLSVQRLLSTF